MGWTTHYGASRADIVRELTTSTIQGYTVPMHTSVGNTLYCAWSIVKDGAEHRFIVVNLLARSREGWGYKDMSEDTHPFSYDCPVAYLDWCEQVPGGQPINEGSKTWREKVRVFKIQRQDLRTAAKAGKRLRFNGKEYVFGRSKGRGIYFFRVEGLQLSSCLYRLPLGRPDLISVVEPVEAQKEVI